MASYLHKPYGFAITITGIFYYSNQKHKGRQVRTVYTTFFEAQTYIQLLRMIDLLLNLVNNLALSIVENCFILGDLRNFNHKNPDQCLEQEIYIP